MIMSNFTDALGTVAGAASNVGVIGGVAKGVAGLLGLGGNQQQQQFNYQKKLMAYQNELNQKNSLIDYQRQRELTADNALLQKIGLRQAGQNTAMGDGSTSSAASVGGTAATSTPSALPTAAQIDSQYSNMATSSAATLSNLALQRSQIGLINSQKENQDIKNITQLGNDMAARGMMSSQAAKNFQEAAYQNIVNKYADSRLSAEADNAGSISAINSAEAAARGAMLKADYDNKVAELELKRSQKQLTDQEYRTELKKLDVMRAQIGSLNASAADSRSHVGVNSATVGNLNQDTENKKEDNISKKNENRLFNDTYSDRISAIRKSSVPDNLYQKIQMWRRDGTFEKLDGLQQAGYGLYEAMQDSGIKMQDALQLLKFLGTKGK